jgi:hypothetical protein
MKYKDIEKDIEFEKFVEYLPCAGRFEWPLPVASSFPRLSSLMEGKAQGRKMHRPLGNFLKGGNFRYLPGGEQMDFLYKSVQK